MNLRSLFGLRIEQRNYAGPVTDLNGSAPWQFLSGGRGSDSGEIVNSHTAMQQASVNACVRLISSSIASMSPILYVKSGTGRQEAFAHPLHRILTLEPSTDCSAFTMWDCFMGSILLTGNGYLEISRNAAGMVTGLWCLHPHQTTAYRLTDGSLMYRTTDGLSAGAARELPAKNVIHVPWFTTNSVVGVSAIENARNCIGAAIAMDKHTGRFFANGATPSGVLSTIQKVKAEDKTKMRAEWEELQSGANQHRVAVLDQDLKFQQISISNEDSQFLESRKYTREEIAGLFGLQPSQIGDVSRVAGETFAAQQLTFLTDCLRPWLNKIKQELTRKLLVGLPTYSIEHDVSDRLKVDFKTMMDGFAVGRQWGFYTANEVRKALGENPFPVPEADMLLVPVNMMDAKKLSLPSATPTQVTLNE